VSPSTERVSLDDGGKQTPGSAGQDSRTADAERSAGLPAAVSAGHSGTKEPGLHRVEGRGSGLIF